MYSKVTEPVQQSLHFTGCKTVNTLYMCKLIARKAIFITSYTCLRPALFGTRKTCKNGKKIIKKIQSLICKAVIHSKQSEIYVALTTFKVARSYCIPPFLTLSC